MFYSAGWDCFLCTSSSSCLLGRRFVSGSHHNGEEKFPCKSFDGPGGVLAHTCMPKLKNAAGDSFFSYFPLIFLSSGGVLAPTCLPELKNDTGDSSPLLSELLLSFWLINGLQEIFTLMTLRTGPSARPWALISSRLNFD